MLRWFVALRQVLVFECIERCNASRKGVESMNESVGVLKILVVDDEPDALKRAKNRFEGFGLKVTAVRSGQLALEECAEQTFDVAYVDYSMPTMNGIETGQRLREKVPGIVLYILSQWDQDSYISEALAAGFDDYFVKSGLSESALRISLLKAQRLLELRRRVEHETELAHSHYGLLGHVRHLVGVADLLLELAEALEPFFQWQRGEYEALPSPLRQEFVAAVLLEGEPGSGKSTVCRAIGDAFGSNEMLPKHLGPLESQGKWQEPLRVMIDGIYRRAFRRQVVVILADDLVWPSSARILDAGLAADWTAYLNTLRECIEDAARINMGLRPTGSVAKGIRGTYRGKVLWLFARNRDEDVGPMFEPLRQKLMAFRVEFPRDPADRRAVLRYRAERAGVRFEEDALDEVLRTTSSYSGRDLIGDETSRRGFLWYAIRKVKQRELGRHQAGFGNLEMIISKDVVEEWLASRERAEIERQIEADDAAPTLATGHEHHDGPVKLQYPSAKSRAKAREVLDWLEEACVKLNREPQITQKMIAQAHGCARPNVTERFNAIRAVALAFLDAFPDQWINLQRKTDIRAWGVAGGPKHKRPTRD